jgi:enoyl-CoA hydratase
VAASGTRFSLPETAFGTTASLGGIFMLTRIVGLGRAFELLYLGERFTAERAREIGLVNWVVSATDLEAEVGRLAIRLADQFPHEMMLTRRAVLDGLDLEFKLAARRETEAAMAAHLGGDVGEGFKRARDRTQASKGGDS